MNWLRARCVLCWGSPVGAALGRFDGCCVKIKEKGLVRPIPAADRGPDGNKERFS